MGNVSQELCEERNTKLHERVDTLSEKVNRIIGGIIVASVVLAISIGGIFYHLNYRFGHIDESLEKIEQKIEKQP